MDSYNLFGDDGSGMLEGLTDLGGTDNFAGNSSSGVAGDSKDTPDNSYRQPYSQSGVPPEGGIQKLAPFASNPGGIGTNSQPVANPSAGPSASDYHEYSNYPPRPRLPQPPHAPLHPAHHVHPSHSYSGYHPGPDAMYAMPDQPGIADMGVWSGPPGASRYSPITPSYRHSYEHQQKMHQYSQQGPGIGALQTQGGGYLPRQPHFSQPTSQIYAQQQNYPSYTQMHPPTASRISQHPTYHQQMEVNPHQYGLPHTQQSHTSIPQHQPHQSMTSHSGGLGSALQNHPNVHLHHAGAPPLHHVPRQSPVPPSSVAPSHSVPTQMQYASAHHSVSMNYQPHQIQHPLDVNVTNQYSVKPAGIETGSPQYRPPFSQLSPQMSPRAQISPRQQTQSQLSPRPVMSPVKGPSASPHSRNLVQSPVSSGPPSVPTSFSSQNTLQALEQMVLPAAGEYPYQRNPASPAVGHVNSSPSQWSQNKISASVSNTPQLETTEASTNSSETSLQVPAFKPEPVKTSAMTTTTTEKNNSEKTEVANEQTAEDSHKFFTPR